MSKASFALLISFTWLGVLFSFEDHPTGEQKADGDQKKPVCTIRDCDPRAPMIMEVLKAAECCPDLPFDKKLVFTESAHFPDPRFAEPTSASANGFSESLFSRCHNHRLLPHGAASISTFTVFQSGDPLIIHEGMVLWVNNDGRYRIMMKVTSPDTAVDLRMQLQVQKITAKANKNINPQWKKPKTFEINQEGEIKDRLGEIESVKTITLPPIFLSPRPIEPISIEKPKAAPGSAATSRTFFIVVDDQSYLFEKMEISAKNSGLSLVRQGTARFGSPVPR